MKKYSFILTLAVVILTSCSTDADDTLADAAVPNAATTTGADASLFPEPDSSKRISSTNALGLCQLMAKFDPSRALVLGETQITDAQLAEIKQFVDENLKAETAYDTYRNIFSWIYKNMTYAYSGDAYLNPYDVFIHKRCICQGYANLLKTMCITQGIPAFCVNGQLSTVGAHAWNYVYADNTWYVSDPTNNQNYEMSKYTQYQKMLIPQRTDLNLFDDNHFSYNYYEGQLNVATVKSATASYASVPYSVEGFRITQFHPLESAPAGITQLYLGKNIESFGSEPESISSYMPNLQEAYVDEANTRFSSYRGIVYKGIQTTPHFVPRAIRTVYLKGMKIIDKNTLYDLPYVEEIYVADATERIEAYAFELCPSLKYVYVPEAVTYIDGQALYRCNDNAQIVRVPTGIRQVTM